jgi:hypothetical protein
MSLFFQRKYFRPTTYTNIPLYVYKKEMQVEASLVEAADKSDDVLEIIKTTSIY